MYNHTLEELKELRNDAFEDYEAAVDMWVLDDEEHERIEELKHRLKDIEEEIARRIGER